MGQALSRHTVGFLAVAKLLRHALIVGLLVASTSGCTSGRLPLFPSASTGQAEAERPVRPSVVRQPSQAEQTVRRAELLLLEGNAKAARDLYARVVVVEPLSEPARPEALYRLGVLQADPASGLRDYRAARATFTQLLVEHPRSRWNADARAWQATLNDLLMREEEARRASQRLQRSDEDGKRAKGTIERLKQLELEQERRR
jgi:hypothetical protein